MVKDKKNIDKKLIEQKVLFGITVYLIALEKGAFNKPKDIKVKFDSLTEQEKIDKILKCTLKYSISENTLLSYLVETSNLLENDFWKNSFMDLENEKITIKLKENRVKMIMDLKDLPEDLNSWDGKMVNFDFIEFRTII